MSNKITISVDNTADLGEETYKKYGLKVVYFGVVIGSELYRDTEVKPEDIYKAVEQDGLLPKTNAALEIDYRELFERETKDGGTVIHISISDKLSASHSNAKRAALGLERVHVIDSKSVSVGTGLIAIKAAEMVSEGKSVNEILSAIKKFVDKMNANFIIKDLNYLYRGGRASSMKLLGANLLKIRPSLQVNAMGRVTPDRKFKGEFKYAVKEWTDYRIQKAQDADKDIAIIVHSDIEEALVTQVINEFKNAGFKQVLRFVTGTTLTTHVGRNMIGCVFTYT